MGFTAFAVASLPLTGGVVSGPLTVAGLLATQAGIANSGAPLTDSGGVVSQAGIVNTGAITSTGLISTSGVAGVAAAGNLTSGVGSLDIQSAGGGLKVKEGANAKQGTAVLAAGTVTVANTSITANSRIFLTVQALGTVAVPSGYCVSARVPGTSFTILASVVTDTSTIAYEIFEPG